MKYTGSYITLFSPSDVTAFHRMKYGGGGVIEPCFYRVTSLRFTEYGIFHPLTYARMCTDNTRRLLRCPNPNPALGHIAAFSANVGLMLAKRHKQ